MQSPGTHRVQQAAGFAAKVMQMASARYELRLQCMTICLSCLKMFLSRPLGSQHSAEAMTQQDIQTAQAVVQSITDDGTLDDLRVQLTKQLKQHVSLAFFGAPTARLHKGSIQQSAIFACPDDLPCTFCRLSCGSTWRSWCKTATSSGRAGLTR